jgi:hypothetical protein
MRHDSDESYLLRAATSNHSNCSIPRISCFAKFYPKTTACVSVHRENQLNLFPLHHRLPLFKTYSKDPKLTPQEELDFKKLGFWVRPVKGMRLPRRKDPVGPVHAVRRTGQPGPRFNYELFNCNNFNIRYWSWNYRGCWHQTCPPIVPR